MSVAYGDRPWSSRRLWSLWEFMEKYDIRLLIFLMRGVEEVEDELLQGRLWGEGDNTPTKGVLAQLSQWTDSNSPNERLNQTGRKRLWEAYLGPLQIHLAPLSLIVGQTEIQTVWNNIHRWTAGELASRLKELRKKIEDELNTRFFFYLTSDEATLYSSENPFEDILASRFPSATKELNEAAQCIALGKGTAAVFHCMRAVESGIHAMAGEVGKTFDIQQWNDILNQIEEVLKGWRKNGITGLSKEDKDAKLEYLSRAALEIGYFKDGWRNYVSHNKRPYDTTEAKSVYDHVSRFISF